MSDNKCYVGIESIDDKYNQVRLGTTFLRNFYTGLDFDENQIMIGLNTRSNPYGFASIDGPILTPADMIGDTGS